MKPYEFFFVRPEQMSPDFRRRMAGHRTPDGDHACFACDGPIMTIDDLGLTVGRYNPDGGASAVFACRACAQLPRDTLIQKWRDAE